MPSKYHFKKAYCELMGLENSNNGQQEMEERDCKKVMQWTAEAERYFCLLEGLLLLTGSRLKKVAYTRQPWTLQWQPMSYPHDIVWRKSFWLLCPVGLERSLLCFCSSQQWGMLIYIESNLLSLPQVLAKTVTLLLT